MKLYGQLFIWVGLDAESLLNGKDFEKEWQLAIVFLGDFSRHQSLVILNHVQERSAGPQVFRRERGMSAHP